MMTELKIEFQTKFIQKDLEFYLDNYWKKSFDSKKIIFDFSITEWISSEEVTFLFSWIIKLKSGNGKIIKVILPYSYAFENDTKDIIDRRKFLKYYLLNIWGMLYRIDLTDINFDNLEGYMETLRKNERFNFGKKIIPFQRIPTSFSNNTKEKVDEKYNQIKSPENGVFTLETEIVEFLNQNSCYSPFENKVISDIITKELVINSMEHTSEEESFFTTALNDKWSNSQNPYFVKHYKDEKDQNSLDFYKDKELILKKIKKELIGFSPNQKLKLKDVYYPSLLKYDDYKNQSFLEFTYLDYGDGIHSTLKKQFLKSKRLISLNKNVSNGFDSKHIHTQILEYAFLLESSKEPFEDNNIRYSELIPRGLYFIIDMVRRYKGLLIARSGFGKIIYDFSNRIKIRKYSDLEHKVEIERIYVAKDAILPLDNEDISFPGTMMSIILPERKTLDFKKSSVRIDDKTLNEIIFNRDNSEYYPAEIYAPKSYKFLNLAFEYQKGEDESTIKEFNSKKGITTLIFKSISRKLDELSGKNCVLFIDFEFIPIKDNNNILKIFLYLSNTPMVNERTKVILLNIDKEDLEKLKEYEISNFGNDFLDKEGYLFKPIPCLRINKNQTQKAIISDIQWIGVHNPNDLQILTNLFFGAIEFNKGFVIDKKKKNKWLYEGNIITKHNGRAYSIFTDFQDLLDKAKKAKDSQLENWLIDKVIDGSKPKKGESQFYFLTSKGSYQRKYLSLYETLNFKYTSKYFAQYLLDKYVDVYIEKDPINYKINSKFNKIIVVTVSSQLLGVEIRNLIKDNENFKFLRNEEYLKERSNIKAKIIDCPKLIKLASYFSFDSEKPFENIVENDNVLIVNDVISTGSLLKRLTEGIESRKATVSGVLTIADSRKKDEDIDKDIEYRSSFLGDIENVTVSILSYENNTKFNLVKLINKPEEEGAIPIKRINPILNAVVSLESKHTEKTKILYEDPEELITKEPFQRNIFRIGHFKQNISHNSYFTNMNNLFYDENGKKLLIELKDRIERKLPKINSNKNDFLFSNLNELKRESDNQILDDAIDLVLQSIEEKNTIKKEYNPKFIFHPVYSGIEEVSEDILHDIFGTDKANILSLQRYETKNGWRFPFPAKRFNKITKGAHVLILDSGALSGHSLVQLIDSISFLEVGRIDFLSVIGRIDDFQRELYSRLRTIKVKSYKEEKGLRQNSIINLNILFGINLHIPPSISGESCPHCKEINKLNTYLDENNSSGRLPEQTVAYIENRVENEIPLIEDIGSFKFPEYIPKIKGEKEPSIIEIFNTRDKLGKVDSYRFYADYFKYFDKEISDLVDINNLEALFDPKNAELLKKLELILICLLHEPHLVNVLKDLITSIYDILLKLIEKITSKKTLLNKFNFEWSEYAIVKLSYSLKTQNKQALLEFFHYEYIKKLFKFARNCKQSINYLSYLLSGSFFELNNDEFCNRARIEKIMDNLKDIYPGKETKESRILNELIKKYEFFKVNSISEALTNLNKYFKVEEAKEGHTEIELSFTDITTIVENYINENYAINYGELFENVQFIIKKLEILIYQNLFFLKGKKNTKVWYGKFYDKIFGKNNIFEKLQELKNQLVRIEVISKKSSQYSSKLIDTAKNLVDFNLDYLLRIEDNNFFIFCDNLGLEINKEIIEIVDYTKWKNVKVHFKLSEKDEIVQVHKLFFKNSLIEILKNASQKAERISKEVTLTISTCQIKENQVELKIIQNCEYDDTEIIGGFNKIVKPIFCEFGVKNSFEIVEFSPKYTFKVNFKI